MGDTHAAPEHSDLRHETRDMESRPVVLFLAGLLVLIVGSLLLVKALVFYLTSRQLLAGQAMSLPVAPRQLPPLPRLQVTEAQDFEVKRASEDAILATYGWVDKQNGIVRIPIERAIGLLAERGLPVREKPEDRESRMEDRRNKR